MVDPSIFIKGATYRCSCCLDLMMIFFIRIDYEISQVKRCLQAYFVMKEMGKIKYFLGIKFCYQRNMMEISQCKCVRFSS